MPTVDRIDGLRVVIYPNDHRPAHVHVIGKGCECVFQLDGDQHLPALRENFGFSERDLQKIKTAITKRLAHLMTEWDKLHGYV